MWHLTQRYAQTPLDMVQAARLSTTWIGKENQTAEGWTPMHRRIPLRKARDLNESKTVLGTIAEIGAGQEVARMFFLAQHASGTIAKSMSAYGKLVSNDIYLMGLEHPEVMPFTCRFRLMTMLKHEYDLLIRRFRSKAGEAFVRDERSGIRPRLFAYCNTMRAGEAPPGSTQDRQGWMGVRIQVPEGTSDQYRRDTFIDLIAHVVLREQSQEGQYQSIGNLGVNMIEAAARLSETEKSVAFDNQELIESLFDGINRWKVRIDVLEVNPSRTNRVLGSNVDRSLLAVREGLTHEAIVCKTHFHQPAQIFNQEEAIKARVQYEDYRTSLEAWLKENDGGATVDDWAFPKGSIREPYRQLLGRDPVIAIPKESEDVIKLSSQVKRHFTTLHGPNPEDVEAIFPIIYVHYGWRSRWENFSESQINTTLKSNAGWSILVARFEDPAAGIESLIRSLHPSPQRKTKFSLLLDLEQWGHLVDDGVHNKRTKEIGTELKVVKNSAAASPHGSPERDLLDKARRELELLQSISSKSAVDCIQRITRTGCVIHVCCDQKEQLKSGRSDVDAFVNFALTAKNIRVVTAQ